MSTKKYRPYLTESELSEILGALKSSPSPSRMSLITYLDNYLTDISRGTRLPNHIAKLSFTDTLALENPPDTSDQDSKLYQTWLINPSSLSPKQLSIVLNYRYLNDLMSPEEETSYEQSQLKF